jgi:8-hydroxy-5-deazaflavin:NADPH oxidoreductase
VSTIGILGGTGPLGRGLARRFATAGHEVTLGSRTSDRAIEVARGVDHPRIRGGDNSAAARAEFVVVAVPYDGHAALLSALREELAGKIVIDCVNPLGFDQRGPFALRVEAGSAAQEAQHLLPDSTVVAAFHHLSAVLLDDPGVTHIGGDVLVLGEDRQAVESVCALARAIPGVRGLYAGRLRNAHQVEALTANLIAINRRYRAHSGLAVTGVA